MAVDTGHYLDATGWQKLFDRHFPAGIALNYLPPHPFPDDSARIIAWVQVVGMDMDAPLVLIHPAGIDRNSFEVCVLGYTIKRTRPVRMAVVRTYAPYAMTWTAIRATSRLGKRVLPWREHWQGIAQKEEEEE